ncbi:MAG: hypothetical protein ACI80S_000599 [Pseudohongiellaceae bacterium]|jgi:hypothetical protein
MFSTVITVILSVGIVCLLISIFVWVKTPYYRVDGDRILKVLEMTLTGQATDNAWHTTFGMIIRHSPELEEIRQRCIDIEDKYFVGENTSTYLFSSTGLHALKEIRDELYKTQQSALNDR